MLRYLVLLCLCISIAHSAGYAKYNEYDPYPFVANTSTCTNSSANTNSADARCLQELQNYLNSRGMGDRLITNRSVLFTYAEDYGHVIHSLPFAVAVPRSVAEISAFLAGITYLRRQNYDVQVVTRGGSGNVQGATQAICSRKQVLLDLSLFNVTTVSGNTAWVGAGASWLSFVQTAALAGKRPTVIPDYLGLTIGGWLSVGGYGADSPNYGPSIDQVLEIQVVTANGTIIQALPGSQYFTAVRGGLGVFAVVTQVKYNLVASPQLTTIIRIVTANFTAFLATMDKIIPKIPSRAAGLEGFAFPNNEQSFEIFVAPKSDLDKVRPNVNAVLAKNQTFVYYIEITVRTTTSATVPTPTEVATYLAPGVDKALIFYSNYTTPVWDNRLKLFTVPALVATGAWYAQKPWFVPAFPATSANVFNNYLQTLDPFLDLGFGLVAIYPAVTAKFSNNSFLNIPRTTPTFYLTTLGRVEATGNPANTQRLIAQNRVIWNKLVAAGEVSVYASNLIANFGPADWRKSFGPKWNSFLSTKSQLDPQFVFGDTRNFGF